MLKEAKALGGPHSVTCDSTYGGMAREFQDTGKKASGVREDA